MKHYQEITTNKTWKEFTTNKKSPTRHLNKYNITTEKLQQIKHSHKVITFQFIPSKQTLRYQFETINSCKNRITNILLQTQCLLQIILIGGKGEWIKIIPIFVNIFGFICRTCFSVEFLRTAFAKKVNLFLLYFFPIVCDLNHPHQTPFGFYAIKTAKTAKFSNGLLPKF